MMPLDAAQAVEYWLTRPLSGGLKTKQTLQAEQLLAAKGVDVTDLAAVLDFKQRAEKEHSKLLDIRYRQRRVKKRKAKRTHTQRTHTP